jgi:hypothetical protein
MVLRVAWIALSSENLEAPCFQLPEFHAHAHTHPHIRHTCAEMAEVWEDVGLPAEVRVVQMRACGTGACIVTGVDHCLPE